MKEQFKFHAQLSRARKRGDNYEFQFVYVVMPGPDPEELLPGVGGIESRSLEPSGEGREGGEYEKGVEPPSH